MDSLKVFLVFVAICGSTVLSKPFTIDILENKDIIFPKRSDLVKRTAINDVSEIGEQKVSLASFIENIETGLLQTALSVDSLASDPHAEVQNLSTPQPSVQRRSTVEEHHNNKSEDSSTPVVLVQTTENVPAVDSVPSHVVIDRVSVFKAPDAGTDLFPTFLVQDTNSSSEATEVTPEDSDEDDEGSTPVNSSGSSESEESTESSESQQSSESSTKDKATKLPSSTAKHDVSSTSSTSTTTSTPKPILNEKQTVEKELKEKIVEVEADPVIFTARV